MRAAAVSLGLLGLAALGGCTTAASLVLGAAGVATDTSMTWDVVKHLHAQLTACSQPALVALAQAVDCPALGAVPADVRDAFATIADAVARSVHHDVVRWLSCPESRAAGLDRLLARWTTQGRLDASAALAFSPLSALHPDALGTPLARVLEARGQRAADAALGNYVGMRASGFEEALRNGNFAALEWWLARRPQLAVRVPGPQLDWLPLARVLTPGYLSRTEQLEPTVGLLLAHGADPWARLPFDPSQSVVALARTLHSPALGLLESAPATGARAAAPRLAADSRALKLARQP